MSVSATASSPSKFNIIQLQRMIAAITVVACHCTFYTSERLNNDFNIYSEGSRGVALFFVISGFVMIISTQRRSSKNNEWLTFILRRMARIAPLYWVITTVKVVALIVAANYVLHAELDIPYILKSYLFIPSLNLDGEIKPLLGVGWTLVYEMLFYIVFSIALLIRRDPFIVSTLVMLSFAIASLFKTDQWPVLAYFLADGIVLDFVFGMVVAKIVISGRKADPTVMICVLLLSLILLFAPQGGITRFLEGVGVDTGRASLAVGILSALIIWSSAGLEDRLGKFVPTPVLFLGAASYSLYLVHPMIGPIVPEVMNRLLPPSQTGAGWFAVSSATGVLASVGAAAIVYILFEKPVTGRLNEQIKSLAGRRGKLTAHGQ